MEAQLSRMTTSIEQPVRDINRHVIQATLDSDFELIEEQISRSSSAIDAASFSTSTTATPLPRGTVTAHVPQQSARQLPYPVLLDNKTSGAPVH